MELPKVTFTVEGNRFVYNFFSFDLVYHKDSGRVETVYPDGATSGCDPVPEDLEPHGRLLNISAAEHRLLHELSHHVVAFAHKHDTCPIVYHDCHDRVYPEDSDHLEHMITALEYFTLKKPMRHQHEWSAIGYLSQLHDVWELSEYLLGLFNKPTSS